jgi:hypothetical protein
VRRPLLPRRLAATLCALVAMVLLCSCQAKVAVDTKVNKDGSGVLSVGVGLDDKALARSGDPNALFKLDDLPAAGWTVTKATKEADGLTWVRVSKPFANVTELNDVLNEVSQGSAVMHGFTFERTEGDGNITYRLKGTIDTTKGLATASDPALQAKLDDLPFGGFEKAVEAEEGKPVADMVSIDVTAAVGDAPAQAFHPTLKDTQPVLLDVTAVEALPPPAVFNVGVIALIVVAGVLVGAMLVGVRRRFN